MRKVEVSLSFVDTVRNVRNFGVMMDALDLSRGEGRMGCVYGPPGLGKTRTAQTYAARNHGIYLRVAAIWKRSELDFIRGLAKACDLSAIPARKGRCYDAVVDELLGTNRPVFIDEVQRLSTDFLTILLDLSDATACPFVALGEPELHGMMQVYGRVWSRTFGRLEFEPISVSEIMFFALEAAGLKLSPEVANVFHASSNGDFRLVRRDLVAMAHIINSNGGAPDDPDASFVTEEMARIAVSMGLKGKASACAPRGRRGGSK